MATDIRLVLTEARNAVPLTGSYRHDYSHGCTGLLPFYAPRSLPVAGIWGPSMMALL